MRLEETKKIIATIMATFPAQYGRFDKMMIDNMISSWAEIFKDYEYPEVNAGLTVFLKTDISGFPPTPAMIIDKISKHIKPTNEIAPLEAWALVSKAISNSNYNSQEEFEKLPPLVQKAVGDPATLREWAAMDSNTVHSVEQSNFLRTYEALAKRAKDDAKLPPELRLRLEGQKVEQIEDKQSDEVEHLLRKAKEPTGQRASGEQIDELMQSIASEMKAEKRRVIHERLY